MNMRFPMSEDLALMVERRIKAIAMARPISDKPAYEIATKHTALPVFQGLTAYYAFGLTGEVLEFDWRRFDQAMPMFPSGRAYGVLLVGARKFPELCALIPKREPDDYQCESCVGTGEHPLKSETGDKRVICECGGLGFLPNRWPEGEPAPAPYTSSVFPDITPSTCRTSYVYHIDSDYDVQSDEALEGLLSAMLDDAEHDFVYYRPKNRRGSERIERAIENKIIIEGELQFFHYRRASGDRNFVHVERHETDDSGAEYLFGYEKRDLLWLRKITSGEMYIRTTLKLTGRARALAEAERQQDPNPFEAKPGVFGFSVDLFKLWPHVRNWLRGRWRTLRREPNE